MITAFNDISREAGWNDASRVTVLLEFLETLVTAGKITADDLVDFADKRCADEKDMGRPNKKVIEARCKTIVETFKDIMDPSCTAILGELYEENIDHWEDVRKHHVFMGIKMEFKCNLIDAVKIAQILFGEK